jgi:phosphate transport system substrate-binding protein
MTKWARVYDKEKGVKVNYTSTGSGAGIQQMTVKTVNFGCTDAPMNDDQLKKARQSGGEVLHIPLVMGGVVPIYNLPGVDKPLRFTGQVLADIFLGKIKKWNESPLTSLNPGVNLPDSQIAVVHRSEPSGTTYTFVEFLSLSSDEWKSKVGGVSTAIKWPTGTGQKGSEGLSGQVARSPGSIGYVELIYALQNKIQFGDVQNKDGEFVRASTQSITAAANNALTNIPDDLRYSLTFAPGKESYPISCTTWAVVYKVQSPDDGSALADFLRWVSHEGQNYAEDLHYARLPEGLVQRLTKKLDEIKLGD